MKKKSKKNKFSTGKKGGYTKVGNKIKSKKTGKSYKIKGSLKTTLAKRKKAVKAAYANGWKG